MNGTQKQIEWAEKIKAAMIEKANLHLEKFAAGEIGTLASELRPARVAECRDEMARTLANQNTEEAGWWIERRNMPAMDLLCSPDSRVNRKFPRF